ncbi:uncharacterized protein LOC131663229 isoform X2 [Phymastichus coffea]|uniref:uncharacterized protein LOC131663229 isoform X2 n=1 Tax=Phymastichus coffea TaxID=108790 RepID=UPI00273BEC58|nr:uncharacterized protein LOC131663229 isoform X2 [Phymastichus coffea]
MYRLITSLDLPSNTISELQKRGFIYVEDLLNNLENLQKLSLDVSVIKKLLQFSENMALDVWQRESQKEGISTCCSLLDNIFENGVQCGVITELSGASFSGKTQICMQLCISVQLKKCHGGLNGRAIYIDTRSGISALRFSDFVKGCNRCQKDFKLEENEAFRNIQVLLPMSLEEFLTVIDNLKVEIKKIRNNKQVRLIIVDSLSMPILCTIGDPLKRPYYYSRILHELHQLCLEYEVAIVITNEVITQIDKDGITYLAAAGGQYVSDYVHMKLELTSLGNNNFAIRIVKSPIRHEMSEKFRVN